jgi:hypothetical protein
MDEIYSAFRQLNFKWLPKHLNHNSESIVFKRRNISFLAINALFRYKDARIYSSENPFKNSYIISGMVPLQTNDKLRTKADRLSIIFRIDDYDNIIPITSYSESDEKWKKQNKIRI